MKQTKKKLDQIISLLSKADQKLKNLVDTGELNGFDKLAAESIFTDLAHAVENVTVMGLHAIGEAINDTFGYSIPKYGMMATFHQNDHIPVVFHVTTLNNPPTEDDFKLFRDDLSEKFKCCDLMDLIEVKEAKSFKIETYFMSSEYFRTRGYLHTDPHPCYNPSLPRRKTDPNRPPGLY